MHALVDADILLYEFGSAKGENGGPLPWSFVISRMDARINNILNAVDADTHQLYITGKGNFREKVATIRKYKGHRPSEKPYWHSKMYDFLLYHRDAIEVKGVEADDAVGTAQCRSSEETIICSRDKDLDMIPGWHYSWPAGNQQEQTPWYQNDENAIRSFFRQLLTGDPVDNIPGLFGVGKSSAAVKRLDSLDSELDMYLEVYEEYRKRFDNYASQFLRENAQLLWILRDNNTNEILEKIDGWEEDYLNLQES